MSRFRSHSVKHVTVFMMIRIIVFSIIVYFIASHFDLFEHIVDFVHEHEEWELDEVIMVGIGLVFWMVGELMVMLRKTSNMSQQFEKNAITDPLTGVLNRRGFFQEAEQVFKKRRKGDDFCITYIDIKGFKTYNDTYGHELGDKALQFTTKFLRQSIGKDDVLARIGGDEFVIMSTYNACMSEKILNKISQGFEFTDWEKKYKITMNYGTAHCPKDGTDIDTVMAVADQYMYAHKNKNK